MIADNTKNSVNTEPGKARQDIVSSYYKSLEINGLGSYINDHVRRKL